MAGVFLFEFQRRVRSERGEEEGSGELWVDCFESEHHSWGGDELFLNA